MQTTSSGMIRLTEPVIGLAERQAIDRVLDARYLSPGAEVVAFEHEWAATVPGNHAVACSSGTTALLMALRALDMRGAACALPSFTCVPTLVAVSLAGFKPVLVEAEEAAWGMDADALHLAIREWAVKVVVPVAVYGAPYDPRVIDVAWDGEAVVVEDCAEAHGARWPDGRMVGSGGDAGCWSFRGDKMITTGGTGGVVVTDDTAHAAIMRDDRAQYLGGGLGRYENVNGIGYGFELGNLAAAYGRAQIPRLSDFIERRQAVAAVYDDLLAGAVDLPPTGFGEHVYWRYCIGVRDPIEVAMSLAKREIETVRAFRGLHDQPVGKQLPRVGSFVVDEEAHGRGLCLPIGPHMDVDMAAYVATAVVEAL